MHKKLILEVFEKAKKEEEKETGIIASNKKVSERISDILWSRYKCTFGDKSLRILYNDAINEDKKEVKIKQSTVINSLCKYIDYENYENFANKNSDLKKLPTRTELEVVEDIKPIEKFKIIFKRNKITIIASSILLFALLIIISINQQRWMVWNKDHYIEAEFDTKKYDINQLKIYKEDRIKYFKKIEPNCEVKYFDESGKVNIWYGKNRKGELEIFTSLGLHPETGKTLKPITKYMIRKYFCEDYE